MKCLIKYAVLFLALMLANWCLAETLAVTQTTPSKAASGKPAGMQEEVVPPAEPDAIFPAVVARINGKPILGRDLESLVRRELAPIGNPKWEHLREDYRNQLIIAGLNTLIQTKLIYEDAQAKGMTATSAEVQAELKKISANFQSDAEMNAALAAQMTDRETLERELYQSLTVAKYIEEYVNKKITITPEEIAQYYTGHPENFQHPDVVRTSHILIRSGETAEQDALAKKRAEALLARAKKGEDFAKLAKEYSTDATASRGGDMGFNSKDMLDAEYGEAAFSLPVGGVALVKSDFGYHILKVTDKKDEGLYTLDDMKDQLTQFLKNRKIQEEQAKLVKQLQEKAKIDILIPLGQQ